MTDVGTDAERRDRLTVRWVAAGAVRPEATIVAGSSPKMRVATEGRVGCRAEESAVWRLRLSVGCRYSSGSDPPSDRIPIAG